MAEPIAAHDDPDARIARIARVQALLADALTAPDPVVWLREHAARPDAPPELRAIDPDGLHLAALLVAKLRFQLLQNGSREAHEWFERDAAGFTAAFRRYHLSVAPRALDPWQEARAFAAWCEQQGLAARVDPR